MNIQSLIDSCENDLRAGRTAATAHRLRSVRGKDLPRDCLATIANFCRRAGLDNLSLRLLTPFVRSDKSQIKPSNIETAEYAAALQKLGGVREAVVLLEKTDYDSVPQADLFLAFCHFRHWEYGKAIPLLERYVLRAPNKYAALVGEMNLAAAYAVAGDFDGALRTTGLLLGTLETHGYSRLLVNAFELRAQVQIARGDFCAAGESLARGFSAQGSADEGFYLRKWSALMNSLQTGDAGGLELLRIEAAASRDWETMREADFFSLKVNFDEDIFRRLLFGTPFAAYRDRVLQDLKKNWDAETFVVGNTAGAKFHLQTGTFEGCDADKPGRLVREMTAALLRDHYKPWSVCALFSELFPEEYYNAFTSPNRVHQLMHRARGWYQENNLPVQITEVHGQFQLKVTGDFGIVVTKDSEIPGANVLMLRKLSQVFQGREFTSEEAQSCLKISSSGYKRLARWALAQSKIRKRGASRATTYRIAA